MENDIIFFPLQNGSMFLWCDAHNDLIGYHEDNLLNLNPIKISCFVNRIYAIFIYEFNIAHSNVYMWHEPWYPTTTILCVSRILFFVHMFHSSFTFSQPSCVNNRSRRRWNFQKNRRAAHSDRAICAFRFSFFLWTSATTRTSWPWVVVIFEKRMNEKKKI